MRGEKQSTCPSCGLEALKTIEMALTGGGRQPEKTSGTGVMMMFKCQACQWQGSTATVNCS